MYLYPFGLTSLFKLFSCSLYVGAHNGDVPIVVIGVVVCRAVVVVVVAVVVVLVGLVVSVEPVLELI